MLLSKKEIADVGLAYVFESLDLQSPYGKERLAKKRVYRPGQEEELVEELEAVELFSKELKDQASLLREIDYELMRLKDIRASIERADRGAILDEVELFEIKSFAMVVASLEGKLQGARLPASFSLRDLCPVVEILDPEKTGLMTFYIYDGYSQPLAEIRKKKKALEEEIFKASGQLREALLNKRLALVLEEDQEEREIRKQLTRKIARYSEDLFENMDQLARLDFWMAKARFARGYQHCLPLIKKERVIELNDATNPMIEDLLRNQMRDFQKFSISLRPGTSVLTGANMGGKSVSLKTLVLNVLLVHLGFLPLAKSMEVGLMDFVFYLSDDYEDVRSGLSSFGAEVIKIRDILRRTQIENGLVVLDEPARGTNPQEGRALVKALGQHFLEGESILLLATHFDQVVDEGMVHYQIRGLADLDLKAIDLGEKRSLELLRDHMDYRLNRVDSQQEVPKEALRICRFLGLDDSFLAEIENLL